MKNKDEIDVKKLIFLIDFFFHDYNFYVKKNLVLILFFVIMTMFKCGVSDPDIPPGKLAIEADATEDTLYPIRMDFGYFNYIQNEIKRIRPGDRSRGDTIWDIKVVLDNQYVTDIFPDKETIDVLKDDLSSRLWWNYDYYKGWVQKARDSWCLYVCGVKYVLISHWDTRSILLGYCYCRPDVRGEARCVIAVKYIKQTYGGEAYGVINSTIAHEIGHAFNLNEHATALKCIMYPHRYPGQRIPDKFCDTCAERMRRQKP